MTRRKRGKNKNAEQKTTTSERLKNQSFEHLNKSFKPGQSRHKSKQENKINFNQKIDTIHSFGTRKNYNNTQSNFIKWCSENVEDFSKTQSFRQLENHVHDYLKSCEEKGLSRATVKTYRSGLSRFYNSANSYNVSTKKDGQRGDIFRESHKHFSEKNNEDIVNISKGLGLRRSELEALRLSDCKKIGNDWTVEISNGKGGRDRVVVVSDKHRNYFDSHITRKQKELNYISDKLKSDLTAKEINRLNRQFNQVNKVINKKLNSSMNIHNYRREYTNDMIAQVRNNTKEQNKIKRLCNITDRNLNSYEKKIKSEMYLSDKFNIREKRDDLWVVSNLLGHSRLDVMIKSYLGK